MFSVQTLCHNADGIQSIEEFPSVEKLLQCSRKFFTWVALDTFKQINFSLNLFLLRNQPFMKYKILHIAVHELH